MRTTTRVTAVAVGLAVLLVSCGGDIETAGDDVGEAGPDAPAAADGAESGAEVAPQEQLAGEGSAVGDDDVVTFGGGVAAGRQLARTADVTLEVADVEQAAREVAAAAARAGGFVQTAQVRGGELGNGRLTLRVPAESLDATVEQVGTVGLRVVSSGISTEDLTDQLVDLGARIDNLEALEAELQQLLAQVENSDPEASELLTVAERINSVRGDIERLRAQRAAAADRVAFATIDVQLYPEATAPEEFAPTPTDTLGRAWATTVRAFETMLDAVIWIVVTILPVLVVALGIPALIVLAVVRWFRARRTDDTPPEPARTSTPPPAPGTGASTTPTPAGASPAGADGPTTDTTAGETTTGATTTDTATGETTATARE